jgi:hypothetical protein
MKCIIFIMKTLSLILVYLTMETIVCYGVQKKYYDTQFREDWSIEDDADYCRIVFK